MYLVIYKCYFYHGNLNTRYNIATNGWFSDYPWTLFQCKKPNFAHRNIEITNNHWDLSVWNVFTFHKFVWGTSIWYKKRLIGSSYIIRPSICSYVFHDIFFYIFLVWWTLDTKSHNYTLVSNHTLRFLLCIMFVYENIFADEIFISETLPKHMHDV